MGMKKYFETYCFRHGYKLDQRGECHMCEKYKNAEFTCILCHTDFSRYNLIESNPILPYGNLENECYIICNECYSVIRDKIYDDVKKRLYDEFELKTKN